MKERIQKLYTEAQQAYHQAKAIIDEHEKKDMPAEKSAEVDRLLDACEAKTAEAKKLERTARIGDEIAQPSNALTPPVAEGKTLSEREQIQTKAFDRFLRHGEKALSETERKALQADDDTAGGFLQGPQSFAAGLLKFVDDLVVVRQLATVNQLGQSESLGVISLDTDLSDWEWTTELSTGSEDTVKPFGKRALTPHPLAKRAKISNTLIRRAVRPVEQLVQQRLGYKYGVTLEKAYFTGNGNQKPLGMFVASNDGIPTTRDVTAAGTGSWTWDNLYDVKYSLKQGYQDSKSTRWIAHRDFVKGTRKLKDGNGQYLWAPANGDTPETIISIPVVQSEFAPNTFTTGLYAALLGDISFYWILDSLQLSIQVLMELYAETNQRGYIGRYEGDGMPMLGEAFARLKLA